MAKKEIQRYFWLKLNKDFFDSPCIKIVESMTNGKEYILFYLKLLCKSVAQNGELRLKENIPFNDEMLSFLTNTNIEIVSQALKIFKDLNMLEIYEDGTLFMVEAPKMLGFETEWARKKKEYRNKQGQVKDNVGTIKDNARTKKDNVRQEIEIEIDKDIDKDIKEKIYKKEKFVKPTVIEIEQYCRERKNNINATQFYDYYESKGWLVGKAKMKDWRACIRTWEANNKNNINNNANNKKSNNPFIEMLKNLEEQEQEGVNNG